MSRLKLGVVQYELIDIDHEQQFWLNIEKKIEEANRQGVDLLLFPECMTSHLLTLVPQMGHLEACFYLDGYTEKYRDFFTHHAVSKRMVIQAGTHLTKEGNGFVNRATLFFPDGSSIAQNKIHLTNEEQQFWKLTSGDQLQVIDTIWGKIAILICYDIEFPELSRIAAERGAQLILCPSYTEGRAGYFRVMNTSRARAIENQLFVALSGINGSLKETRTQIDKGYTQAAIFSPCDFPFTDDGIICAFNNETLDLIVQEIDFVQLRINRDEGVVAPFFDRRPGFYERERKKTFN